MQLNDFAPGIKVYAKYVARDIGYGVEADEDEWEFVGMDKSGKWEFRSLTRPNTTVYLFEDEVTLFLPLDDPDFEAKLEAAYDETYRLLERAIDLDNPATLKRFLENVRLARDEGNERCCVFCGVGVDGLNEHEDFCPCAGETLNAKFAAMREP